MSGQSGIAQFRARPLRRSQQKSGAPHFDQSFFEKYHGFRDLRFTILTTHPSFFSISGKKRDCASLSLSVSRFTSTKKKVFSRYTNRSGRGALRILELTLIRRSKNATPASPKIISALAFA